MPNNKDTKRWIRPVIFITGVIAICYFLITETSLSKSKLLESEFLFTAIGLLLGFALTLLTFIISMLDKIKEYVKNNSIRKPESKEQVFLRLERLYRELKDDIYFIFITLIIVSTFLVIERVTFPGSEILKRLGISKNEIIYIVKLAIFLLNLFVIYDLLSITFRVSDTTVITHNNPNLPLPTGTATPAPDPATPTVK